MFAVLYTFALGTEGSFRQAPGGIRLEKGPEGSVPTEDNSGGSYDSREAKGEGAS